APRVEAAGPGAAVVAFAGPAVHGREVPPSQGLPDVVVAQVRVLVVWRVDVGDVGVPPPTPRGAGGETPTSPTSTRHTTSTRTWATTTSGRPWLGGTSRPCTAGPANATTAAPGPAASTRGA